MTPRDLADALRERTRYADPLCMWCSGTGTATYTARNADGEADGVCECLATTGYTEPDDTGDYWI